MEFLNQHKRVVFVVTLLVIGYLLASLTQPIWKPKPGMPMDRFAAVGEVVAEETAKLLGGHGEVVLVIWNTQAKSDPIVAAEAKSFTRTAKKMGLTVTSTERVSVTPNYQPLFDEFVNLLNKNNNASAIVSLAGIPWLQDSDYERIPQTHSKLIVLFQAVPPETARQSIERGIVQMAVISRSAPPADSSVSTAARAWFDGSYQIVTPQTLDTVFPSRAK